METAIAVLAILFAVSASAAFFALLRLAAARKACGEAAAEAARLSAALESRDASARKLEEAANEACRRLLAEKDESCARLLAEKNALLARKDEECAARLRERDEQCEKTVAGNNAAIERFVAEKEKAFAETVKTLREQFATLAAGAMKTQSADLTALNRQQMEAALKPLRDQVARLQDATLKAEAAREGMGAAITRDVDSIARIARELSGAAGALRSDTRVQGRSGEDILAEKLRQAGLEENVNFFLQNGTGSDRPDAQVRDTENRWLVIDSKTSLTAYMEYSEAKDDATRAAKLAAHVASVKGKIDQLARKKYPAALSAEFPDRNYLPVTAMFVPYEAPLEEALRADPSLWQTAAENNVILVTPLTLLAYLRLVYLAWQHEKEAKNQREIVDTARELLSRMNSFLLAFEELGGCIASLGNGYEKAKSVLVDSPGAHSIAKSASKLLKLHVRLENRKGKKAETAECLRDAEEDAGDAGG